MAKKRRRMPAALRAYWAKRRKGITKTVRKTARRIKRRARRTVAAAPVVIRRSFKSMAKKRRTGSRRRRAFGSSSSTRGQIAGVSLKALAGTVGGMLAANQLAPRIAAMTGQPAAGGQRPFLQGQTGQAMLKVGIGLVGGYALKRVDRTAAAAFVAGAIAEPAVAAIRAMLARQNAGAGVAGLYGYLPDDGIAGYLPDDGVSGLGEVIQDDIQMPMGSSF